MGVWQVLLRVWVVEAHLCYTPDDCLTPLPPFRTPHLLPITTLNPHRSATTSFDTVINTSLLLLPLPPLTTSPPPRYAQGQGPCESHGLHNCLLCALRRCDLPHNRTPNTQPINATQSHFQYTLPLHTLLTPTLTIHTSSQYTPS